MEGYQRFNQFLSSIDVNTLRDKYRHIKIVELDMPKDIQCLMCAYEQYWKIRDDWVDFEKFYTIYSASIAEKLEDWRKKCLFSKETFYRGLPARICRTWTSLLTQIQGAYVAESIYGKGKVRMGVDIDHLGKDLVIDIDNVGSLPVQIKKLSRRSDIPGPSRRPRNRYIVVNYKVPTADPKTKTGKDSKPFMDWLQEWDDKLTRLDNGFIVFKPKMFETKNLLKGLIE